MIVVVLGGGVAAHKCMWRSSCYLGKALEDEDELARRRGVEAGGGLVEEEQRRVDEDLVPDAGPLPLASRHPPHERSPDLGVPAPDHAIKWGSIATHFIAMYACEN